MSKWNGEKMEFVSGLYPICKSCDLFRGESDVGY